MKIHFAVAAVLFLSLVARANEIKTEAKPAAVATISSTRTASTSPLSWLQTRGTMSTDDVVSSLGIAPDKQQREEIEKATNRRNEALQKINDEFSRDLQKTLAANDQELAAKVQAESDRLKMARMKSRQPGRYNGVKKEK